MTAPQHSISLEEAWPAGLSWLMGSFHAMHIAPKAAGRAALLAACTAEPACAP